MPLTPKSEANRSVMAKHQTFKKLVTEDEDFVGMIAYSVYKKDKINWIESFKTRNEGREPSLEEIENGFNIDTDSEIKVSNYRALAEEKLNSFIDLTIAAELSAYKETLKDEAIVKAVKTSFWGGVGSNIIAGLFSSAILAIFGILFWMSQVKNDPIYFELLKQKAMTEASISQTSSSPQ
jgi:hypothetical protein